MTTINVSEGAYKRILKRKQEIEEELQRVISIAGAVDSLLGVTEVVLVKLDTPGGLVSSTIDKEEKEDGKR